MTTTTGERVRDLMTAAVTIPADATVSEAALLMIRRGTRYLLVTDRNECLLGVISSGSLARSAHLTVEEVMRQIPTEVGPNEPIHIAAEKMLQQHSEQVPVVSDGKVLGVLRWEAVCHAFRD